MYRAPGSRVSSSAVRTGSTRPAARCSARSASARALRPSGFVSSYRNTIDSVAGPIDHQRDLGPCAAPRVPPPRAIVGDVEAGLLTQRVGDGRALRRNLQNGFRPAAKREAQADRQQTGKERPPRTRLRARGRTRGPGRA